MPRKRRPSLRKLVPIIGLVVLALVTAGVVGAVWLSEKNATARAVAEASNYTPQPAALTPKPAGPKVAFIGDSYTAGAGASAPSFRWSTRLSNALGWGEVNLGRGGTGYANSAGKTGCGLDYCPTYLEMVPEAIAAKPNVVVIAGGRNDRWKTPEEFKTAVTRVYEQIHDGLPDAKVYAVTPVWDDDQAPANLADMKATVIEQAKAHGATVLDIGEPLSGRPDAVASDGGHPNDLGHKLIADAVAAKLPKA